MPIPNKGIGIFFTKIITKMRGQKIMLEHGIEWDKKGTHKSTNPSANLKGRSLLIM